MAKRKQRIYTRYKPQKAEPHRPSRGVKRRLIALVLVILGAAWWAAAKGKIVLPGPFQKWVQTSPPAEPGPETTIKKAKDLPPISSMNFGTSADPVRPPAPAAQTAAAPPKVSPGPVAVIEPPVIDLTPTTNAKPEIKVELPPPGSQEESGRFRPRSAWSTFDVQLALARNAISPGILDGFSGPQTVLAIKAFQQRAGLEPSGKADIKTKSQLVLSQPPYTTYIVTSNDVANLRRTGKTWQRKAAQDQLGYESIVEMVAEKSHAYTRFIEKLNPNVDVGKIIPGVGLKVPLISYPEPTTKAAFLRISLTNRTLQAYDGQTNLLAHFPCSIAQRVEKRPVGELKVINVVDGPNYTFDPLNFPPGSESRKVGTKLTIQPGPNNPVGSAWIGLSKPGYGIHGTPLPEKIGRTESLGCFRLANWDASYLLHLVTKEMPVFVEP